MVLSAFFFAVMTAFARLAGDRLPAQEVVFARAFIAAAITFVMIRRAGAPLRGQRPVRLALRGITGFLSLSCQFVAVLHMPFAEAVLLGQTAPVFTVLLAWWSLGERPGRRYVPAAALVFAGVLLTVPAELGRLSFNAWSLVALLGAVFAAGAYTQVRSLAHTEHPLTIVFWFLGISALLAVPGTIAAGPVLPRGLDWLWLAGLGITGQLGQLFLTSGLRKVPAGRGSLANPLVVGFGALLGFGVFGEPLGWNVALGGAAIVLGLLVSGLGPARPAPVAAAARIAAERAGTK